MKMEPGLAWPGYVLYVGACLSTFVENAVEDDTLTLRDTAGIALVSAALCLTRWNLEQDAVPRLDTESDPFSLRLLQRFSLPSTMALSKGLSQDVSKDARSSPGSYTGVFGLEKMESRC